MAFLKKLILNVVFYIFYILFTVFFILVFSLWIAWGRILVSHREEMRRLRLAIWWYGRVTVWGLPKPFLRIRYMDKSGDADAHPPYIIIGNHRSSSDPFLMGWVPFEIIQIVNIWPFKIPLLGWLARLAGYLSVHEMPFDAFSQRCGQMLDQGVSIIAFPEGTRSGNKTMGQFRSSIFRVALGKKIPIVPLCISGNEDKPPRGTLWLNPGRILLHRLPTVPYEEFKSFSPFKLKNYIRGMIEDETKLMDAQK